ncbi:MAG: response regulator [Actinomycetia bacterium]|nr:response regulator [Actinomycetes bacterium]
MNAQILIVDDEPSVRALVRDVLELDDYAVTEAADGNEALAQFGAAKFDVIILDIMMPGISGLDVLRQIRATDPSGQQSEAGSSPEIPVILLTAASDDETTWAGWASGASVFLAKPFDPTNLIEWVERTIAGEDSRPSDALGLGAAEDLATEFRGLQE